ncbi:MAG: hypothetical protein U0939_08885 [Pirellulales bacterium]
MHPESGLRQTATSTPSSAPSAPPPAPTLPVDLTAAVRADAQRAPAAYLRATEVPHGGE